MLVDSAESRETKLDTASDAAKSVLRWFAKIGAAVFKPTEYFLRPTHPASAENLAESAAVTAGAVATTAVAADVDVRLDAKIDCVALSGPDTQEIERRRNLVRTLFNDFWSEAPDKPAAFVERLDQAEDYLNERLAANGEFWRLDAKTRVMLGLPPRSSSNGGRNNSADRP
jgi:hypothetical protein